MRCPLVPAEAEMRARLRHLPAAQARRPASRLLVKQPLRDSQARPPAEFFFDAPRSAVTRLRIATCSTPTQSLCLCAWSLGHSVGPSLRRHSVSATCSTPTQPLSLSLSLSLWSPGHSVGPLLCDTSVPLASAGHPSRNRQLLQAHSVIPPPSDAKPYTLNPNP